MNHNNPASYPGFTVLQLSIQEGCSWHVLAQIKSLQPAPKAFWWRGMITQFSCNLNSSKNFICLLGKLRTQFTSPIANSTSPGLSDTTFFAHWVLHTRSSETVLLQRPAQSSCFSKWTLHEQFYWGQSWNLVICRLLPFRLQVKSHVDWWFFISESMSLSILKRSMEWMKFSLLMR